MFASKNQQYIIKEVYQYTFQNVYGTKRVQLDTLGLVINWMWFLRRSDCDLRNEWSNYTNWPYNFLPFNVISPVDGGPIYTLYDGTTDKPFDTSYNYCPNLSLYPIEILIIPKQIY